MKRKRVVSEHYVNNKEFLEALVVFNAKCLAAKEAGEQRPQISNYIGECFLKILSSLIRASSTVEIFPLASVIKSVLSFLRDMW